MLAGDIKNEMLKRSTMEWGSEQVQIPFDVLIWSTGATFATGVR